MGSIAEEVRRAILTTGVDASESAALTSRSVIGRLAAKYSRAAQRSPLWEHLEDDLGFRKPEGWRLVSRFAKGERTVLAFEPRDENTAFEFADGAQLEPVLANCSGFEFYVTNLAFSYVLCFNHHDYLIAAGTATTWLREIAGD